LILADGRHSRAAKLLGCGTRTIGDYIKRFPALQEIEYDYRIALLDASKDVIKQHTLNGSLTASMFNVKNLDPDYQSSSQTRAEITASSNGAPDPGRSALADSAIAPAVRSQVQAAA
jgi:hypothetical protein